MAAAMVSAIAPSINALMRPTTHGHARRCFPGGVVPGGTYADGGRYGASSFANSVVNGLPSSMQELRFGSLYVRLQVRQRFICDASKPPRNVTQMQATK